MTPRISRRTSLVRLSRMARCSRGTASSGLPRARTPATLSGSSVRPCPTHHSHSLTDRERQLCGGGDDGAGEAIAAAAQHVLHNDLLPLREEDSAAVVRGTIKRHSEGCRPRTLRRVFRLLCEDHAKGPRRGPSLPRQARFTFVDLGVRGGSQPVRRNRPPPSSQAPCRQGA
jgi:hypothetical protein